MVKLVSVMRLQYESIEKVLKDFLQEGALEDPKEVKRQRILDAAAALFIKYGYRKTNISDVAKQAGVAKGTVYLYFKSKPEILAYAIANEKKRYIGVMKEILSPDKTPYDRIREWLRQLFILGSRMPLTSRVLNGDQEVLAAIFDFIDHYKEQELAKFQLDFIRALIGEVAGEEPISEAETTARAKVLLGLAYLTGMLSNEKIRGGLSIERFAEVLSGMLTDGVCSPDSRPRGKEA